MSARAEISAPDPSGAGTADLELAHARLQGRALQAEAPGRPPRTSEHPVGLAECPQDGLALGRLERDARERGHGGAAEFRHRHAQDRSARQDDGALDGVLELAYVAR